MTMALATEIPMEPKIFLTIAKSAVASPFSSRGKVEKVIVLIGTKRKASPARA